MAKVFFKNGFAWTLSGKKRQTVLEVDVPIGNDCCKLDCCKKAIVFTDDAGNLIELPLCDIAGLLGITCA